MPAPSLDSRVIPAVEYVDTTPVQPVPVSLPTASSPVVSPVAAPVPVATPTAVPAQAPSGIDVGWESDFVSSSQLISADYLGNFTIMELVQMFVVYAFIIAAALSAVFIFVGGISFILSGGNEEKITKAVNTIRYAIVGLIITILSFTFVTIVGRVFGLNFLDYLSYSQIKNSISHIMQSAKQDAATTGYPGPR